jgi:hypothetical protein
LPNQNHTRCRRFRNLTPSREQSIRGNLVRSGVIGLSEQYRMLYRATTKQLERARMTKMQLGSGCLLMALVTPMMTGCRMAATGGGGGATWKLVVAEDFTESASLDGWILDGAAEVTVTAGGELLVQTLPETPDGHPARCSVLWYPTPVWGDIR